MKKRSLNDRLADKEKLGVVRPKSNDDRHSAAFRRQFKDHAEFTELDENGRARIKRVYLGVWRVPSLPLRERRREQALLVLLYLAGLALFLLAATRPVPANGLWYLAAAQFVVIAAAAYTLTGLYNYLTAGEKLTEVDYNSGTLRVRYGFLAMAAAQLLCALLYLFFALRLRFALRAQLLCALFTFFGAAALFAANRLDARIEYHEEPNKEVVPDDAVRIE